MGMGGGPVDWTHKRNGLFVLTEVPQPPAERNSRVVLFINGEVAWEGPMRIGPIQWAQARQDLEGRKAT